MSSQLIGSSPNDQDKELLTSLGHHILGSGTTSHVAPPSSLARVMFHHLFKVAPAPLDVNLSVSQKLGFDVALQVLGYVSAHEDKSVAWFWFLYSVCRLWSKLAKVLLCSTVPSEGLLDQVMRCILKQDGLLGSGTGLIIPVTEPRSHAPELPYNYTRRIQEICPVEVKCRVTSALARTIGTKRVISFGESVQRNIFDMLCLTFKMPKEVMNSESNQALKLCAIQLGAHSLWLQKTNCKDYGHSSALR